MDEFIEKFTDFRDWLYSRKRFYADADAAQAITDVIMKFEELELDNAF